MNLVAFVGNDTQNWGQVTALINRMETEKIILITSASAPAFPASAKCETVKVNTELPLLELKKEIMDAAKPLLASDFEVGLSLASGSGKEHMALIAALLSIPVGIRLVVYTKNGVEIIN